MSQSTSPGKASPSTSAKTSCAFCFAHTTQCRCSPYKVAAHRLQTKELPELEQDLRERAAQIEVLTEENHNRDDVTRQLRAQIVDLNAQIKVLQLNVSKRDKKIDSLQTSLEIGRQTHREEQRQCQDQISELKHSNETLCETIQSLVKYDICQAAKRGDIKVVSLWLSLGCDVNKRDHEFWTPLHWASGSGRSDIADVLLQNRADIRAKDDESWEPLHWAASGGHMELVNLLISSQADVNSRCKNLHTPMHWANAMGHTEVVRLLKRHGGIMTEDQTVLDSRLHPRLKEHEASNTSGIGWTKFEHCPTGFVRLSFFIPNDSNNASERGSTLPRFEISNNQGRSWSSITLENRDHENWGGRLYLSDPFVITRDVLRCVWQDQPYGPRLLPYEQL